MAIRKMKMRAWQKATAAAIDKPSWGKLNGDSPGGVANSLGISRQAVHQAIRRGSLDALIVVADDSEELRLFMIPSESVEAFKKRPHHMRRAGSVDRSKRRALRSLLPAPRHQGRGRLDREVPTGCSRG